MKLITKLIDKDKLERYLIDKMHFYPALVRRSIERQEVITILHKRCDNCERRYVDFYKDFKYCPYCGKEIKKYIVTQQ